MQSRMLSTQRLLLSRVHRIWRAGAACSVAAVIDFSVDYVRYHHSMLLLNLDRSYFWYNYTISASVGSARGGGFVFRMMDNDHYYRFVTNRVVSLSLMYV